MLYNEPGQRFVMWVHADAADYDLARMGVATSAHPQGPYTYHGSFRPHGQMARDFTLFKVLRAFSRDRAMPAGAVRRLPTAAL